MFNDTAIYIDFHFIQVYKSQHFQVIDCTCKSLIKSTRCYQQLNNYCFNSLGTFDETITSNNVVHDNFIKQWSMLMKNEQHIEQSVYGTNVNIQLKRTGCVWELPVANCATNHEGIQLLCSANWSYIHNEIQSGEKSIWSKKNSCRKFFCPFNQFIRMCNFSMKIIKCDAQKHPVRFLS